MVLVPDELDEDELLGMEDVHVGATIALSKGKVFAAKTRTAAPSGCRSFLAFHRRLWLSLSTSVIPCPLEERLSEIVRNT